MAVPLQDRRNDQVNACKVINVTSQFLTEFELVNTFLKRTAGWPSLECALEVDSGNGIADIVLFDRVKNCRGLDRLALVEPRWAYALSLLPAQTEFTTDEFAKIAGTSRKTAFNALFTFSGAKFCAYDSTKKIWKKRIQPSRVAHKFYAVEAKLRDWRKALAQACRYLDYAHQAWVLLDNNHISPALKNITSFQRYNIGLCSIDQGGETTEWFTPTELKPKSEHAIWATNVQIARQIVNG